MTPLELLASYHRADDDDVDDERASAEDAISQVFSSLVLSNGAPVSCVKEDETTKNNTTTILEDITVRLGFHHRVSCDDREDGQQQQQQQQPTTEWNAALELIRLHLQVESSPPSPRELLRTVVFDPYFVDGVESSLTHTQYDAQEQQERTNHGRLWCNVLGVLLVCHAVQSATRRVDSMRMEAIAFYQRHCLDDQSLTASLFVSSSFSSMKTKMKMATTTTETATMMSHTLDIYWHLLFQYLVPSVLPSSSQQQQQQDTRAISIDPPSPLVACGVVCTLLDLVEMTTTSGATQDQQQQRKDELLCKCLQRHLLPTVCPLDILLNHPIRCWEQSSPSSHNNNNNNNDTRPMSREWFDCARHGNPDLVMNTQWNPFGLALLARFVWTKEQQQQQEHHASNRRSPEDCWSIYFPHVAHLLCGPNTRINKDDDDVDDDDENVQEWQRRKLLHGRKEGLELLESLLVATENDPSTTGSIVVVPWEHLEDHPMTHTTMNMTRSSTPLLADLMAHPLCPVGTVQLILNQVMSSSSSTQNKNRKNPGEEEDPPTTTRNTQYYLQLARSTLARYHPMYQVECLHRALIPNCPYPMLQPLLLDWMRPLGILSDDNDHTHTTRAYLVSRVLHPLIQTWMDHENKGAHDPHTTTTTTTTTHSIHSNHETTATTTTTNTISTTKRLVQVDQLMEQMEFHVSTISLVRLFLLQEHDDDNTLRLGSNATAQSYHFMSRALFEFNDVLESQLQRWSSADANNNKDATTNESVAPSNFFKLYLLQDAIHELRDTAQSKKLNTFPS